MDIKIIKMDIKIIKMDIKIIKIDIKTIKKAKKPKNKPPYQSKTRIYYTTK